MWTCNHCGTENWESAKKCHSCNAEQREDGASYPLKIVCPYESCGGGIEIHREHAGLVVNCPHCGNPIQVPEIVEENENKTNHDVNVGVSTFLYPATRLKTSVLDHLKDVYQPILIVVGSKGMIYVRSGDPSQLMRNFKAVFDRADRKRIAGKKPMSEIEMTMMLGSAGLIGGLNKVMEWTTVNPKELQNFLHAIRNLKVEASEKEEIIKNAVTKLQTVEKIPISDTTAFVSGNSIEIRGGKHRYRLNAKGYNFLSGAEAELASVGVRIEAVNS